MDHTNLHSSIVSPAKPNLLIDGLPALLLNPGQNQAIVLLQQWWGFNQSIAKTAKTFTDLNLTVLVPDLYRGKVAKDHQQAGHHMNGLNWQKAFQDIQRSKEHLLKKDKSNKVTLAGFCMGGALTIASLCSVQGFSYAFPFYGIPQIQTLALNNIKTPILGFFGQKDPLVKFSDQLRAKELKQWLKSHKQLKSDVVTVQGVGHAFMNQDSKYFNSRAQKFCLNRIADVLKVLK